MNLMRQSSIHVTAMFSRSRGATKMRRNVDSSKEVLRHMVAEKYGLNVFFERFRAKFRACSLPSIK